MTINMVVRRDMVTADNPCSTATSQVCKTNLSLIYIFLFINTNMEDQIYFLITKMRHMDKMFNRACEQVDILNDRLAKLSIRYRRAGRQNRIAFQYSRYRRAGRQNRIAFQYSRKLQISRIEGVRNIIFNYGALLCKAMGDLNDAIYALTGLEYDFFDDLIV